jgi:hypothetical protein
MMRHFVAWQIAALSALGGGAARAYTTGISGYSGKTGELCTECHAAGTVKPKATLSGPTTLAAGAIGTYTLLIDTDVTSSASTAMPRSAGLDVATTGGTLGTVVQMNSTRILDGELSHTDKLPRADLVQVMFTLKAPDTAGTVTLYAAALSANGDGTNQGDGTDSTQLAVQVSAPPPPDLATPLDLAGLDLAGLDLLSPPDLAPPPDLAMDVVTSATPPAMPTVKADMGPPRDEPRWACDCQLGAPVRVGGVPVLFALMLAALLLRRR